MRDITTETFQAVLFDNDGTLIDSSGSVERSWTSWAADRGFVLGDFSQFHGQPSRSIVAQLAPGEDLDQATADLDERELNDVEGVIALPGAVDALRLLGDHAAIVTSAGAELARRRLAAAGIPRPGVVISADDITRGKPDPQPYLLGAERLGVDPAQCLVVEDAVAGLTSGRAAGAATLAITATTDGDHGSEMADLAVPDLSHVRFEITPQGVRVGG